MLALALRLIVLGHWIESPGDGPSRALVAYHWARMPSIPPISRLGDWLPGYAVLTGVFAMMVPDPLVSTRILNVILGTSTVPVFYWFVRAFHGRAAALFSASVLTVFPLHVALSATSMSEVSSLLETCAATVLLVTAAEGTRHRALYLTSATAVLTLALMTRWEIWPLILLVPLYYVLKARDGRTAMALFIALAILPGVVFLVAYRANHNLLGSASATLSDSWRFPSLEVGGIFHGLKILGRKTIDHLGWPLAIAIVSGLVVELTRALRGRGGLTPALHLSLVLIAWPLLFSLAITRGLYGWDRYMLFALVVSLPFAFVPFRRYVPTHRQLTGGLTLIAVISVIVAGLPLVRLAESGGDSPLYITSKQPVEIRNLARWLAASPYRDDAVLITQMGWEATYLLLYFPPLESRHYIVAGISGDSDIRDWVARHHPALFITRPGDEVYRLRTEAILGKHFTKIVHTAGPLTVYSIAGK